MFAGMSGGLGPNATILAAERQGPAMHHASLGASRHSLVSTMRMEVLF